MDETIRPSRQGVPRFVILAAIGLAITVALGVGSHVTHSATIPNVGLPASNSRAIPHLNAYDPQVAALSGYLTDLAQLNYQGAYQRLAPSVRASTSERQFEVSQKAYGQIGRPSVWIDDPTSARAEYVIARPGESAAPERHRFRLKQEQGQWWVTGEIDLPAAPAAAAALPLALHQFVEHQAGSVWTQSIEILRQEPFEGGQLLLFSYIEPHPATQLTPERTALLSYYVNGPNGWQFAGGGLTGHPAGMSVADIALGLTTFGPNDKYTAYYGVVENANAASINFVEPNGAGHTLNLRGQKTILVLNERNPFEAVPFDRPFKSIVAKDTLGNTLKTNPPNPGSGNGLGD